MLDGSRNAFVLYDPSLRADAMHAALFRRPFVTLLRSPRLYGPTQDSLARMGLLAPLIELAATGALTAPKAARLLRARRHDPEYLRALTRRIARSARPGLTAIAAKRSQALSRKRAKPGRDVPQPEPVA